jgi:hypothetical protein
LHRPVHVLDDGFLRLENLAFQKVNDLSFAVVLGFLNTIDRHSCRVLLPVVLSSRNACLSRHGNSVGTAVRTSG